MKNYISLMAVLALVGCAGGSEGPDGRFRVSSSSKYVYATEKSVKSNQKLTSMNSEVVVCNGTCPEHLNRITGTPSHARVSTTQQGGVELKVYDLSDVSFTMADEGFDTGEDSFKFIIDDNTDSETRGKIIGIDMGFAEDDSFPADKKATLSRQDDTNVFNGYVNDPDNDADPDKWKDAKYTYASLGKGKLRFSDFGTLKVVRNDDADKKWTSVFIGGYDAAKKIAPENVALAKEETTKTMEFSGTATGGVTSVLAGQGSGKSIDITDTNAKLTLFVDKSNANNPVSNSKLEASFDNWYDVVYTEDADTKKIELSNYQGTNDFKMLTAENDGVVTIENTGINSDIRYFGDNKTPTEAVGLIQVRDCNGAECTNDYGTANDPNKEVRMNIGFGVVK